MQRWIVSGAVMLVLLLGSAAYGWRTYQQGRPHPVWVPLTLNAGVLPEQQDEMAKRLKEELTRKEVLLGACGDLGLRKEWNLASDEECAAELKRRMFVRAGELDTPNGRVQTVDVGVNGAERESGLSHRISKRLMVDVARILRAP